MENLITKERIFDPVNMGNELYNHDKIYIMDNHLLAIWCWVQKINTNESYNFFHIDRHFDLLINRTDESVKFIVENNINLQTISIDELLDYNFENKIFTHDNYIIVFDKLYSNLVEKVFITHNDGAIPQQWQSNAYNVKFYELFNNIDYWVNDKPGKFILNIDMDYFIRKYDDGECLQIFTDEYIAMIGQEIRRCYDKVEVITIALTPTFSCNMRNSKRLAKILLSNIKEHHWNI